MLEDRWLKIIKQNSTVDAHELLPGFMFSELRMDSPEVVSNNLTISGKDGEMPGQLTFAPFNITLKCAFDGWDESDAYLAELKLREIFASRERYVVISSQMPGIKFPVEYVSINQNLEQIPFLEFEITLKVHKGYSESLYETDQYDKTSDKWQFGNGLLVNDDIQYKHNSTSFKIFNGSSDTIAPFPHRHKLIIKINVNAPNGFKLHNRTTGDVFEYKKAIKSNQQLIINGVYPTINGKRVGIDTNHEWLSLAPGYNDIEITGTNITQPTVEFIFPFIYR
ncbi:phage tail domain-containing protein [Mammaliicoccus lentus]|uniref:phage tail domain-containing protein n=1 Tax=Mammaliicoccus lentus TaxID=42858 RepID=UPI001072CF6D|nr:phage tail domain-containing protein [Mammaliicoccus lentus]MBF0793812.1 phage tail family protein [Mammaliicoccus lentus]TFV17111.1 phage tail family protein [Mammaliicoccus lentus]